MPSIGTPELLIVLAVILLLFGAKKLPEMARSLGKAKGEFKKGLDEGEPAGGDTKKAESKDPSKET
ncbi:MAG: twin-arginine translocase TatA/TatE family subunit [Actinomycetota bacterium]